MTVCKYITLIDHWFSHILFTAFRCSISQITWRLGEHTVLQPSVNTQVNLIGGNTPCGFIRVHMLIQVFTFTVEYASLQICT